MSETQPALMHTTYVNRTKEINAIRSRINRIRMERTVFDNVLCWYGIPGIGKSALGWMIANLCQEMNIPYARIDFETDPERIEASSKAQRTRQANRVKTYAQERITLLEDLLKQLAHTKRELEPFRRAKDRYQEEIDPNLPEKTQQFIRMEREKQVVRAFRESLRLILERSAPIVLIFDTTDKADPKLIPWLEEELISPLALTGRALIIWLGRYPQRWNRFEIRRRTIVEKLEPFPIEGTRDQIGQIGQPESERIQRIHRLTHGHPLSNREAALIISAEHDLPDRELLKRLIDQVIDRYVLGNIPDHLQVAIRTLAPMRQFDIIIIQEILKDNHFVPDPKQFTNYIEVLSDLAGTYLVEWDAKRKGYAIDPTLRRILSIHMLYETPSVFKAIQERAQQIYASWIKEEENRNIYLVEYLYHSACLHLIELSERNNLTPAALFLEPQAHPQILKTVTDRLGQTLSNLLNRYYKGRRDREKLQRSTDQLRNELQNDEELPELLSKEGLDKLTELVNKHLQKL